MLLEIEMKTRVRLEFIHLFVLKNDDARCILRMKMKVLYSELIF